MLRASELLRVRNRLVLCRLEPLLSWVVGLSRLGSLEALNGDRAGTQSEAGLDTFSQALTARPLELDSVNPDVNVCLLYTSPSPRD